MFWLIKLSLLLCILLNGVLTAPAHYPLVKRYESSISKNLTTTTVLPSSSPVSSIASSDATPSSTSRVLKLTKPSSSPSSKSLLPLPKPTLIPSIPSVPFPNIPQIPSPFPISTLFAALFPKGITKNPFWTTAAGVINNAKPLSLESFNALSISKIAAPRFTLAPDGTPSLEAKMVKGTYEYHNGPSGQVGLDLYANPLESHLANAKEITFSYRLMFSENYEAVKGGKLPGLYGGNDASEALTCSGGRRDPGCFSVRFMWRKEMQGEAYTYLPNGPDFPENKQICSVPPYSTCNDEFGASVGRGSWTFQPGKWQTIAQRVRLNDHGQKNGEMEVIVGGVSMFDLKGLTLVTTPEGRFQGIMAQVFPGGHDSSWAPSQDQSVFFKDFSLVVTETY